MRSPTAEGAVRGLRFVSPRQHLAAYVDLVLQASSPYVDFVYGDVELARRVHKRLVEAEIGEFAAPFAYLAVDAQDQPVGMVAGPLFSKELAQTRFRTAMALMKDADFASSPSFRERGSAARDALLTPSEGDAYLSRIAVVPNRRGSGVGRHLLDHFVATARSRGARRAVLEVSPVHGTAAAMYEKAGFRTMGHHSAQCGERSLEYVHMGLELPKA